MNALPVMAGYFVVSFVFGMMCVNYGLPIWFPTLMCFLVYAGAAQFSALALLSEGEPLLAIALSTLLINSRHILMSFYMSNKIAAYNLGRWKTLIYSFGLTDESFAIHSHRLNSSSSVTSGYLICFNTFCLLSWALGGFFGGLLSDVIDRISQFKLDYALSAMMVFVLVSLCTTKTKSIIAVVSIVCTSILNCFYSSELNVFVATAIACGVGVCSKKYI